MATKFFKNTPAEIRQSYTDFLAPLTPRTKSEDYYKSFFIEEDIKYSVDGNEKLNAIIQAIDKLVGSNAHRLSCRVDVNGQVKRVDVYFTTRKILKFYCKGVWQEQLSKHGKVLASGLCDVRGIDAVCSPLYDLVSGELQSVLKTIAPPKAKENKTEQWKKRLF
jgi:hypothetical protein